MIISQVSNFILNEFAYPMQKGGFVFSIKFFKSINIYLLILDEPAAALDPQGRRDVLEVMEKLRKTDDIAYIRFASVYRSFTDIDSFEKALRILKKKK